MRYYVRKFLRNRNLVLATAGVLILGIVFAAYTLGKNHSDARALPATTANTSMSSNKKVEGATTSADTNQSNPKNGSTTQTNKSTASNSSTNNPSTTTTPKTNTSTTPSGQQQSGSGGSGSTGGSGGNSTPTPPAQPTITFSGDACTVAVSNAAGYTLELDVQDAATVADSRRGGQVSVTLIPASGSLTLSTGAAFTMGTTYSLAIIKDSLGNTVTQKTALMSPTCS